jgi:hypothetical protein
MTTMSNIIGQQAGTITGLPGGDLASALAQPIFSGTGGDAGTITFVSNAFMTSFNLQAQSAVVDKIMSGLLPNLNDLTNISNLPVSQISAAINNALGGVAGIDLALNPLNTLIDPQIFDNISNTAYLIGDIQVLRDQLNLAQDQLLAMQQNITDMLSNNLLNTLPYSQLSGLLDFGNLAQNQIGNLQGMISGQITNAVSNIMTSVLGGFAPADIATMISANTNTVVSGITGALGNISGLNGTFAGGAGGGTPFGGRSTSVFTCGCSGNIAVYFNDLTRPYGVTLPLIYQPGFTTLYDYGRIYTAQVWILGLWTPGGSCRYFVGKGCLTLPTAGTMTMVGTSMY